MMLSEVDKARIKRDVVACLSREREVRRIVVFGSFVTSREPNDLDVAVFQDSDETYLPLAMKYRRLLRPVADQIPLDVLPLRSSGARSWFVDEIEKGEVVYER